MVKISELLVAPALMSFGANKDIITMSGFSSGGFMTLLMHVIHLKTIKGTGLVATGPYMSNDLFHLGATS